MLQRNPSLPRPEFSVEKAPGNELSKEESVMGMPAEPLVYYFNPQLLLENFLKYFNLIATEFFTVFFTFLPESIF
jgi:hypothetical protein